MCLTKLLYRFTSFKTSYISFGRKRVKVYLADSSGKNMLGLMHRSTLRGSEGMLLMPGREARHGIWMYNMRFAIDIVWLSRDGVVVDIRKNAMPCKSILSCPTYTPRLGALYILEVIAGGSKSLGIRIGSRADMSNINKPLYG